jgi:hypothetical protein
MMKAFKWQLIENKLALENDELAVTPDEIRNYVREFFMTNYFSQFNQEEIQDHLNKLVADAMKKKEDVKRIYDMLFDKKAEALLAVKMKLDEQSGDFEAFIDCMKKKNASERKGKAEKQKEESKAEVDHSAQKVEEVQPDQPKETKKKTTVTAKKTTTATKKATKKEE